MDNKEILEKVAPCSLMCYACSGYKNGIICESAKNLLHYFKGIKEFYKKHMPQAVEDYTTFEGILTMYSSAPCSGCRSGVHNSCSIDGCFILECSKEHGVDFCGECDEFPCKKAPDLFEEEVYRQWLEGSQQIKDHGIEWFVLNNLERPHYEAYKSGTDDKQRRNHLLMKASNSRFIGQFDKPEFIGVIYMDISNYEKWVSAETMIGQIA